MTTAKKASFLVFAAFALAVVVFHLGPVLLAGLFSFMILDLTHRALARRMPEFLTRALSVLIFLVTAIALSWLFGHFLKLALSRLPVILGSLIPTIGAMADAYGLELPFENLHEFRQVILETIKENARSVTRASGLLTKGFFHIVIGIFVAILCFLSDRRENYKANLLDEFRREFRERVRVFMLGFEKVLGAQVLISLINTTLTFVFLLAVGLPFVHFLTLATFIFGILPIIGNILSNAIIVGTALTISPLKAVFALAFLVVIHKGEYFLNSRIVGSSIETPMWVTLLGILVGEVVMGIPGIILAPALIYYIREELRAIPAPKG